MIIRMIVGKNTPIMRFSDYNYLRHIIGLDAKTINSDEFIVHSDTWNVRKKSDGT